MFIFVLFFFTFASPPCPQGLYELRFHEPYESLTDPPSVPWWNDRRDLGGLQAEAFGWTRVAMAEEIVQAGVDETQVDSTWIRCVYYYFNHTLCSFQRYRG